MRKEKELWLLSFIVGWGSIIALVSLTSWKEGLTIYWLAEGAAGLGLGLLISWYWRDIRDGIRILTGRNK